ncbi:MAG: hypothetical protein ACM3L6_03060 [Deltaproteobacteria bacterium]
MAFFDLIIQGGVSVFVALIILWALSSFAELRICRYLYDGLSVVNRLIASRSVFDLKVLPDVVVTEGTYRGRKAVARLNVVNDKYLRYRIHVHLLIQPACPLPAAREDPLAYRHPARTIVWKCSLITPPSYGDIQVALKDLAVEAEAFELEKGDLR